MAKYRVYERPQRTTIIERDSGGNGAVLLISALLIALAVLAAYFLLESERADTAKNGTVVSAAHSVAATVHKPASK